ncbi:MAG: hypothetical protein KF708_12515 [Pirellulales bacterium]|nr:hypothetical protein [Pirellulales bacterium]
MATPRVCAALVLATLSSLCWWVPCAPAAEPTPRSISIYLDSPDRRHEDEIRQLLTAPTMIDMVEVPLADVIAYLSDYHHLQILLDRRGIEEAGCDGGVPITLKVKNISLESALNLMLDDLDLTWIIENGVLRITSHDRAEQHLTARLYPVSDLVAKQPDGTVAYEPLVRVLTKTIAPSTWDEVGGPSSIVPYAGLLVVSTTDQIHRQCVSLLQAMRSDAARANAPPAAEADARHEPNDERSPARLVRWSKDELRSEEENDPFGAEPEAATSAASTPVARDHRSTDRLLPGQAPEIARESEKRVQQELNRPTTVEFVETELSSVLRFMEDLHKTQIVFDKKGLEEIGVSPESLVTQDLHDVPLYLALDLMLDELGATWTTRDGLIVVTTEEATHATKIYPLGDLLEQHVSGEPDYQAMTELVTSTIAPESWKENGAQGSIRSYAGTLVIYQSAPVHRKIERFLAELRVAARPELLLPHVESTAGK